MTHSLRSTHPGDAFAIEKRFDELESRVKTLEAHVDFLSAGSLAPAAQSEPQVGRVLVWSMEHNAWWRPSWCGYTAHRHEAGRYPRAEAQEIVGGSEGINERIVELAAEDSLAVQPCGACDSGTWQAEVAK